MNAGYGHRALQVGIGNDRIHWASTETATEFAGHIEGAIRAGESAAARVLEHLRLRATAS
jgi:monoamine oxidase